MDQSSAYLAFNIAANRAAFSLRRFLALGFSKRRRIRNCCKVCSRSSFFLSRRMAFSTDSPFFSLISVIINSQSSSAPSVRAIVSNNNNLRLPGLKSPAKTLM